MRFCSISVCMVTLILAGCQQRVSFPPKISLDPRGAEQVIVQGDLSLIEYQRDGQVHASGWSNDSLRPKGVLYPDFLVVTYEKRGVVQEGESGISQEFEQTIEVIPTRLITSIKFVEKGTLMQTDP